MKKKIRIILLYIIFVLLLISVALASSYAYYTSGKQISLNNVTATTSFSFSDCTTVSINGGDLALEGNQSAPVDKDRLFASSQEILNKYKTTLQITNKCTSSKSVSLILIPENNPEKSNTDSTQVPRIPVNSIYYLLATEGSLTGNKNILGDRTKKTLTSDQSAELATTRNITSTQGYILSESNISIAVNETKTYDLYMWIDYNATKVITGYQFHGTIFAIVN